ncbi:hypothetical protein MPU19_002724 [Escherichia coli]|nr:hypothetical protein [Escherichia coli]EIZ4582445.1 hypothetical protein [Escherichia coli]
MSDITANVVVSMPSQLFTMARSFKAVANGKIYIGKIGTDPVNPENQIQVYVENEDGSHVPVSQPIIINAAGYPVYNGQIAKFVTVQGHSMAVYDAYGAQQFYFPNVLKYDPDQFRAIIESPEGAGHVGYQYRRNTGSTMRMVSDVLDERVSLWDFHCDPSGNVIQPGVSVDSRQHLQAAIDYLSAKGGGTLHIPEGATWYLNSISTGAVSGHSGIIQLKSNVDIKLDGTIKVGPALASLPFQVFVGFDNGNPANSGNLENCHIYGHGVVDFGDYEFGASSQLRNGVAFGRSYNCSVTGITFQNGDVTWAITLGWNGYGSNCYVRKCRFINLVNSSVNADHSTVYVNCPYSGVESCYFSVSSSFARNIACSVELHQHDTFYRGSTVNGYCRGAYVVMHAAEAVGAGAYSYHMLVENNIARIYGQFVILGSDISGAISGHLNDVVIAGNIVSIGERAAFSAPFGAFIDIGPGNSGASNVQDIQRVLVTGNSFYAPANITDSAAITLRANLNGCTFIANNFDCRYMVYNAPGTTSPVVQNLVWDKSNVIGGTHANQRAGQNLFDMQFASVVNSTIEVQLSCEDLSMFSCILFPASCQLSYSKITVDSAWTKSMSNTAVFEGNQQAGANVYVSYPATVNLTSYNTQGAVPFFSTDTNYAWVTSAYSLSSSENLDFSPPATYTNKANGQLVGVGYNETGEVRSVSVRLMLQRQV